MVNHHETDQNLSPLESSSEAVSEAVHTGSVDRWRSELTAEELKEIESVAGEVLGWLGYLEPSKIQNVG